jgi:hypothetical protein
VTNAQEQLEELWTLSDEGKAEWWAKCVRSYDGGRSFVYYSPFETFCHTHLTYQHALDLVTCEAERWLVGKGWGIFKSGPYTKYTPPHLAAGFDIFESLPEALAYAMEWRV